MKKIIYPLLVISITLLTVQAYSQQTDSLKKTQVNYLSKELAVPEATAAKVAAIMNTYKENAKKVIDKKLGTLEAQAQLNQLIEEKNKQLALLLTEQQLNKIVPTSERIKRP